MLNTSFYLKLLLLTGSALIIINSYQEVSGLLDLHGTNYVRVKLPALLIRLMSGVQNLTIQNRWFKLGDA